MHWPHTRFVAGSVGHPKELIETTTKYPYNMGMESVQHSTLYRKLKDITARPFNQAEIEKRLATAQKAAEAIGQDEKVQKVVLYGSTKRMKGLPKKSDIDLAVYIDKYESIINPRQVYEVRLESMGITTEKNKPMRVSVEIVTPNMSQEYTEGWQKQLLNAIAHGTTLYERASGGSPATLTT